ncbi:MAG: hypothetical protein DMG13_07040 [Acidobacteria bacterium]|nr:MAG: hypothetical protein DMG13_07040 [Acidobacteriota bacterium]
MSSSKNLRHPDLTPFSAAERHKNVATAEGRGKHYRGRPIFDGCALSRLHSQPLIFLMAARCRACIRSRSLPRQGRKTVALEKSFAPAGASFCQTETTAFSRGYVLTPLRGSFRLIPNSSRSGVLNLGSWGHLLFLTS